MIGAWDEDLNLVWWRWVWSFVRVLFDLWALWVAVESLEGCEWDRGSVLLDLK